MNAVWSRTALCTLLLTALLYLISLIFIDNPYILVYLKPLPIIVMLYVVWQATMPLNKLYAALFALFFSVLGDITLALPINRSLELGIGFFFIAHGCYSYLLLCSFRYNNKQFISFALILLSMCAVMSILLPFLGAFRIPVIAYFIILALMVFSALQVNQHFKVASSGALLFLLSDTTLAFSLFVYPNKDLRFIIMLTYYLAQFLLTSTILLLYSKNIKQSNINYNS